MDLLLPHAPGRRGRRTRARIDPTTSVLCTVAAVVLGAAAANLGGVVFSDTRLGVAAGIVLLLMAGAPTVARLRSNGSDAAGIHMVALCLVFGIGSLAWLREIPPRLGLGLDHGAVADALRVVAVGLVCFGIGARVVGRVRRLPDVPHPSGHYLPSLRLVAALYTGSALGVVFMLALGAFGYISRPEATASLAPVATPLALVAALGNILVLVAALAFWRTGDRSFRWFLTIAVPVQVAFGMVAGQKTTAIFPLVAVIFAHILVRRRVPRRAAAVTVLLLLLVVVPVNRDYRLQVRTQSQDPAAALRSVVVSAPDLHPLRAAESAIDYSLDRFRSIDSVALIRTRTPSPFAFAGGERYWQLPGIVLVPRIVWPDKPVLDEATRFTSTYVGVPSDIRSATQITAVGDLYRNFGFIGVVVGMSIWGAALASIGAAFVRWRSPRADVIYLFALMAVAINADMDLPGLLATASKTVALAAAVAWLLLPGRAGAPGAARLRPG